MSTVTANTNSSEGHNEGPSVESAHDSSDATGAAWPTWFRYALVAVATLILCSCSTPPGARSLLQDSPSPAPTQSSAVEALAEGVRQAAYTEPRVPTRPSVEAVQLAEYGAPGAMPYAQSCPTCTACQAGPNQPMVGPSDEYLCDGGDFGLPAGVRADWTVDGVEQEDTIAHYDTVDGRVVVAPSNRVCIYAPRFAAVRRVTGLSVNESARAVETTLNEFGPVDTEHIDRPMSSLARHTAAVNLGEKPASLFRTRDQAGEVLNLQAVRDAASLVAPYANFLVVRLGIVDGRQTAEVERAVQAAITWTGDQAAQVVLEGRKAHVMRSEKQADVVYALDEPNHPLLRLLKLASTGHALPGEEVEFTIRFDNVGNRVIGNVTLIDNLATRLEYVPDSAKSSVDANFSVEPNDGGSQVLRWEIVDPVETGQGGILTFRARVR